MSKAIILQHVPYESPGRIIPVFRDFGIPTEIRRLDKGDEVPMDLEEIRVLVVLGGPMGVADIGKGDFPYLAKEVELLKRLIERDRPVLGICLGAQLLAHAAGAKVYPNVKPGDAKSQISDLKSDIPIPGTPMPELGWGPVTFPFPGGTEPIVMGLMDGAMMFHWHFDTFDLPRLPAPPNAPPPPAPPPPTGNALLSSTRVCKNQAFRFRTHLFGFQYHFEFNQQDIEAVLANAGPEVRKVLGDNGLDEIRKQTAVHYPRHARLGDRVLRNFIQFLKLY